MMKPAFKGIMFVVFVLLASPVVAQFNTEGICRLENGRIIFLLLYRWTAEQQKEVSRLFNLDSAMYRDGL